VSTFWRRLLLSAGSRKDRIMFRGLSTVSFFADDVAVARNWYAGMLQVDAYFVRDMGGVPVYVEFRVGDHQHELGIVDRRFAPGGGAGVGGAIVYWHVDDVRSTVGRLLDAGATEYEGIVERGPGFVTASVVDPFGNVLGVMENAHYLEMLTAVSSEPAPRGPASPTAAS
jgi:predicted enzyme related to lactoylglutathione lyase